MVTHESRKDSEGRVGGGVGVDVVIVVRGPGVVFRNDSMGDSSPIDDTNLVL